MRASNKTIIILTFAVSLLILISLFIMDPPRWVMVGGVVLVFVVLYYRFTQLTKKILERDEQLERVNRSLESEIQDRKSIEEELSIHRDYLEGLITEGTRELEIKNQEIEASEKKFRTITASIQDGIIMTDGDHRVSFCNRAALRIFGYTLEEMQGEYLYKLIVPDYVDAKRIDGFQIFRPHHKEMVVEEIFEVEARRQNGELFPIEISMSVVNIQGTLHTVSVIRDATRRKERERNIKILSSAVEQSSVGVMITDTDGRIQYVNPKFTEVTGYEWDEAVGELPGILNSNMHPSEFFKSMWDTIQDGREWHGELQNMKKNGELYWDASVISPIKDGEGKITHFVAIKEDITERKRMEVELVAARKSAEAASRSKSEFLANMSHEIRTPMNAIIGMTELVLDTQITKEQREYLKIVQQSSSSLLSLLNDILDLSKIEAGKLSLEPIPFNLPQSLGETVKTLGVQAYKKDLELVYYIDSEVPSQLIGDMGRLRQIVVNLIGNSIKFTKDGEIVLKVEVMEELPNNRVLLHFMISDTGIGIPEEKQRTIFEKFSQADTSTTRKYGGSGLGLAISSLLVGLMDGMIWVESPATFPHFIHTDMGSTFHFTAAFQVDTGAPEAVPVPDINLLRGLRVLIVDDNRTNRRFLMEIFSKYHLVPEEAESGEAALTMLTEKEFQLVVLDYQMPGMDGGLVLQNIRQQLQLAIPVILLTSGIRQEVLDKLKDYDLGAFFFKPVNTRRLLERMVAVMGFDDIPAPEADEEEKVEVIAPPNSGVPILVVEDNRINQQLIKRLLEKRGHLVDIAGDGAEAVKCFANQSSDAEKRYRLIFMDIQMPVMDGIKATREIRKQDADIPIIALTAHAMKGDRRKFLSEGMNDYISKPIHKTFLFELLDKYLSAP